MNAADGRDKVYNSSANAIEVGYDVLHVCKHSNLLCSVIFVNFYNFSTMTSLCRHLSVVSTGNCKLGHDCRRVCSHRRHTADATVLSRRRRRCVLDICHMSIMSMRMMYDYLLPVA